MKQMIIQNPWSPDLVSHTFREAFTPEQRARLLAAQREYILPKDEIIYRQDDAPRYLYYVMEGTVRIYREGRTERAQTLRFIGPGEIFGYRAALADEHYAANAATHCSTTLLAYPISLVRRLLDESPRLMRLILQQLARELGTADRRLVTLTKGMLRERMAETLLYLHSTYANPTNHHTIGLALTRRELAELSNMSTSNAIRTLKAFEQEGAISFASRTVRILDEEKLRALAQLG